MVPDERRLGAKNQLASNSEWRLLLNQYLNDPCYHADLFGNSPCISLYRVGVCKLVGFRRSAVGKNFAHQLALVPGAQYPGFDRVIDRHPVAGIIF